MPPACLYATCSPGGGGRAARRRTIHEGKCYQPGVRVAVVDLAGQPRNKTSRSVAGTGSTAASSSAVAGSRSGFARLSRAGGECPWRCSGVVVRHSSIVEAGRGPRRPIVRQEGTVVSENPQVRSHRSAPHGVAAATWIA
jgi:hypothetical protein